MKPVLYSPKRHFLSKEFLLHLFQFPVSALKQCFLPSPRVEAFGDPAATGGALMVTRKMQVACDCTRTGRHRWLLSSTAVG